MIVNQISQEENTTKHVLLQQQYISILIQVAFPQTFIMIHMHS